MGTIPRFLSASVPGFKIIDIKEWLLAARIDVYIEAADDPPEPVCHRCGSVLAADRGKHRLGLEGMPILGLRTFFHLWRQKGHCSKCKKARAEALSLVADETPHLMQDYAWWVGRLCEIAAVSRVAELLHQNETTTWRMDFNRTSALSEGVNNVIKMLKRRAFDYRNMEYFRLKIMQVCGYLNRRFIPSVNSLTYT